MIERDGKNIIFDLRIFLTEEEKFELSMLAEEVNRKTSVLRSIVGKVAEEGICTTTFIECKAGEAQEINKLLIEIEELNLEINNLIYNIGLNRSRNSNRLFQLFILVIDRMMANPADRINFKDILIEYAKARTADFDVLRDMISIPETINCTVH